MYLPGVSYLTSPLIAPLKEIVMLPAYPIALSKSQHSRYGFYCYREDGGFCFHNFHGDYAAKNFVETLIDDHEFRWIADNQIVIENGIRIKGERDSLERVFEYDYASKEERDWRPGIPSSQHIAQFMRKKPLPTIEDVDPQKPARKPRAPVPDEVKVQRRKAKAKSGDYITISQICEELGHHPRVCRAELRAMKLPKPAHGWAWPPSEAQEIKKKLAKRLA